MDFRKDHCAWCGMRNGPIEDCEPCPKYRCHGLGLDGVLTMEAFCGICIHRGASGLEVFCRTNRFLQEDSGEDFDCYRFSIKPLPAG
jgi:hypothetical protein